MTQPALQSHTIQGVAKEPSAFLQISPEKPSECFLSSYVQNVIAVKRTDSQKGELTKQTCMTVMAQHF